MEQSVDKEGKSFDVMTVLAVSNSNDFTGKPIACSLFFVDRVYILRFSSLLICMLFYR